MSAPTRLAAFAVLLGAVFAAATLAGAAIDPSPRGGQAGDEAMRDGGAAHGGAAESDGAHAPQPVRGLAVAEKGLRLDLGTPELRPDATGSLRFRILGADGRPVRDFDVEHERRMHVIVVRRDLTGVQHLHPRMAADGTWSVPLRVAEPGTYRVLADFSHDGGARTLGADLRVSGDAALAPLPAPARTADAGDGVRVTLASPAPPGGREAELRFRVTRGGREITPEPYLGARGHLVALREGDLAFLHVHPVADDGAEFAVTFPSAGAYRLFLQIRVDGAVRTAPFTVEVDR